MCLVKVRQEEDVVVPYRTVVRTRTRTPSPHRRSTSRRISRTEVIRESRPASSSYIAPVRPPSASYIPVPAPKPLEVPPPQPVPVFVAPPPPPPQIQTVEPSHHHHHAHYVEVSPQSSVSSHSPSRAEYIVHEREYHRERRRDYSPESEPRYEHYRYVDAPAPPSESDHYERYVRRERSRSRARSRSRGREYGGHRGSYDDGYRETRERVRVVVDDGDAGGRRRSRQYYR